MIETATRKVLTTISTLLNSKKSLEIEWANGSRVKSLPATRHAGSSWTASLVIMDEAAKIQWANDLYTALKPTIDGGGLASRL